MAGNTGAVLLLGALVVLAPLLTVYWPKLFGVLGVFMLTAAGVYFAVAGKSAFTEITSAVLIVGAFSLAALLAIYRSLTAPPD